MATGPRERYGHLVRGLRSQLEQAPAADRGLAVGLAVFGVGEVLLGAGTAHPGVAVAAVLAMTLPLAVRRAHPLPVVALAVVAFVGLLWASDLSSDEDAL